MTSVLNRILWFLQPKLVFFATLQEVHILVSGSLVSNTQAPRLFDMGQLERVNWVFRWQGASQGRKLEDK